MDKQSLIMAVGSQLQSAFPGFQRRRGQLEALPVIKTKGRVDRLVIKIIHAERKEASKEKLKQECGNRPPHSVTYRRRDNFLEYQ